MYVGLVSYEKRAFYLNGFRRGFSDVFRGKAIAWLHGLRSREYVTQQKYGGLSKFCFDLVRIRIQIRNILTSHTDNMIR